MSEIRYFGKNNGAPDPDAARLQAAKAREREAIASLRETELARKRQDLLERREVQFVVETMAIVLRQDLMRLPFTVVKDLRLQRLSHEVLFAIRMSVDKTVREALTKASASVRSALNPRKAIAEFVGAEEPSPKEVDAAERKKARKNARRRVVRRVAP